MSYFAKTISAFSTFYTDREALFIECYTTGIFWQSEDVLYEQKQYSDQDEIYQDDIVSLLARISRTAILRFELKT